MLKYMFIFLYPFFIGFLMATMLDPFVTILERRLPFSRFIATLFITFLFIALFILCFIVLTHELMQGLSFFLEKVPTSTDKLLKIMNNFIQTHIYPQYENISFNLQKYVSPQWTFSLPTIDQLMNRFREIMIISIEHALKTVQTLIVKIPESIAIIIFTGIISLIMTKDYRNIRVFLRKYISLNMRQTTLRMINEVKQLTFQFVKAQITLVLITTTITFICLLIFKVKNALTIIIIIAIADFLPLIGTGVIFIPWLGYLFFTGNYSLTIKIALMYIGLIIIRQMIEPKIFASHFNMHPLGVLLIMFLSFKLWGLIGLAISPLFMIIIIASYRTGLLHAVLTYIKTE